MQTTCISRVHVIFLYRKSRLHVKIKSFPAFELVRDYGTIYNPTGVNSLKEHSKEKIHKLPLTVLEIEDY